MEHHLIIVALLLLISFLSVIAPVQWFSYKTSFPYTIALLAIGFVAQLVITALPIHLDVTLPPDVIYFVLLPILLFEAALHINLHQFRLQFATITFLATFGVLTSLFVTAVILTLAIGLPFSIALLFGALISATDPIAVLALFKTLGAPKRLGLLADGESMFNDATAVIAFRLIAGFVIAENAFGTQALFSGVGNFLYIFLGSLLLGSIMGVIWAYVLDAVRKYPVLVNTLSIVIGLGSFVVAEHFFHLSGVITTVAAGIALGNFARTKLEPHTRHTMEHLWELLGFVALSLVFFFAAYSLHFELLVYRPFDIIMVILSILVARAVSVYASFCITNRFRLFAQEPNVPLSWQHVLNWGGLRGVIPLVLVYSLPDEFAWKQQLLGYTLIGLLFTMIVNGLTITRLLKMLGLHIPKKEEQLLEEEQHLFALEEVEEVVAQVDRGEFDATVIDAVLRKLHKQQRNLRKDILRSASPEELRVSLLIQAIAIERDTITELYHTRYLGEIEYYQCESELDLQQDALEYPEVFRGRGYSPGGFIDSHTSFRSRLIATISSSTKLSFIRTFGRAAERDQIARRYRLLRARILSSQQVLIYYKRMLALANKSDHHRIIDQLIAYQHHLIATNTHELQDIKRDYPSIVKSVQQHLLTQIVTNHPNLT